jgi:hypothetical protein
MGNTLTIDRDVSDLAEILVHDPKKLIKIKIRNEVPMAVNYHLKVRF